MGNGSEKVNATRIAGKREKEPENNPDDETFLPPKRKNSKGVGDEYEANDVRILHVEAETRIAFYPPSQNWQKEKSSFFGLKVKNYHKTISTRQTHYAEIRQKVIENMTKNRIIFEQYTNETLTNYLKSNKDLGRRGKWGTAVEIRAVASMLNTNVYVYCTYGTEQNCSWNKYNPINSASESNMYILHWNNHYEPVLDVEDCEFQDLFSRPPYLPICSGKILEICLCPNTRSCTCQQL
ncbi:hypothetical protein CHS0354_014354 [Potamilus streckersoni]|uniref:OTU domain-containing protein n=1 Tax=Potamilus streckersoni TaxID=2493646 RepID=A0AAE0SLB3_9BIVA|nr:hypothetical protein CHS0354_014354 [Potamilus streckersoni]